ncbi:MAG: capsular polysaccharide biosynthesis protein [Alphaproteobacteria bacterium]|nr:MAG: capsular polysaccharide biosynthesis protein [Alphaproteobacteria bacterium]
MRRLGVVSLGLARRGWLRRVLELAGWAMRPGPFGADAIGVWGRGRAARRGMALARRTGLPVVTLEDAFLRSLRPGAAGEPPYGLIIDDLGIHYDAERPSRLELLLQGGDPLAGGAEALALWQEFGLSKYNHWLADARLPAPGYVLVADQNPGDASIAHGRADAASFARMLEAALDENPGLPVLIRTHPAAQGAGHLGAEVFRDRVLRAPPLAPPAALIAGAARVYAVTSQLGFEAILAGQRPRIFGMPFYAGWGLGEEELRCPRRTRRRSREELFAACMLRYPLWYDPFRDRLSDFATIAGMAQAEAAQWRENAEPAECIGVRAWKRRSVARFLNGPGGAPVFSDTPRHPERRCVVWASRETPALRAACADRPIWRMEDGFIRSLGLGARLVAPASLVLDDLGIYYDPARPSRLERLIATACDLPAQKLARAARLRAMLVAGGIGKYNLARDAMPDLPPGRRVVLVAGQVEDDASVRLGATGAVRTNRALLQTARAADGQAFVIYKPHPDVLAGLRPGAVEDAGTLADLVIGDVPLDRLFASVSELWTMTSLMGFEALLRGVPVVCLGAPFYAGWGLTRDLGPVPEQRVARPSLDGLVHAALIDYPRYVDPVTGRACPVEVIVDRLAARDPRMARAPSAPMALLARLQDRLSGHSWLWR